MPTTNKSTPLSLTVQLNGTIETENVEQKQINKQNTETHNSNGMMLLLMLLLLMLLMLLLPQPLPRLLLLQQEQQRSGQIDGELEKKDSDPEDHNECQKAHKEDNTHVRKKRMSKGRVFQCAGYPDCNMSFTRSEHLARHKRKHTGERPFTCPHCHKNFSRLDNLRQHKQTVHACENFMGNSASNTPITANYNHGMLDGNTIDIDNANNHISIQNHLSRNSGGNNGNPESPLNSNYGSSPGSTAMISPPNTNSPINYHYPYQNQVYQNHSYDLSNNSGNNNFKYPQSQLKTQINEFKPKRRPRPLSLVHSFTENTNLNDKNNSSHVRKLLKSAPAMYNTKGAFTYTPKSVSLTPNMVSPLSPLFHRAFNQTMDLPPKSPHIPSNTLRLPPYNHHNNNNININNNTVPNKNPSIHMNNTITLPSVQELPIPVQLNPIKDSKTWLKEVLNDESSTPPNNANNTNNLSIKQEDEYDSKKPTIDNLLSPYDDKFQDSPK